MKRLSGTVERLCMERHSNRKVFDEVFRRHDQNLHILFIGREEGRVVEIDGTHVMAFSTTLALLCNKCEEVLFFLKDLYTVGVLITIEDNGILDELRRLHVACNLRSSSPEELRAVFWLERHGIVHEELFEVDETGVAPGYGGEGVVMTAERNELVC